MKTIKKIFVCSLPLMILLAGCAGYPSSSQHEVGHVFGAEHPKDSPAIADGTTGVMCKDSCGIPGIAPAVSPDGMFASHEWSQVNSKWIRENSTAVTTAAKRRDEE